MKKAKQLLKSLTPPALIPIGKKIARKISRKNSAQFSIPEIHIIQAGPLAGEKIFVDASGIWQQEMLRGNYDAYFFDYLKKLKLEGKIVLDIGTHVGYHALAFAKMVGPRGKVFAFEPNTFNFERLRKNIEINPDLKPRINLVQKAVSDKQGTEEFVFNSRVDKGSSSGSFLDRAHTIWEKSIYEEKGGFKRMNVETVSLDHFIEQEKIVPYLVKIDIEGAEYLALQGAAEMLSKIRPIILIEIHSIFNMHRVQETFDKASYSLLLLEENADGRCFFAAIAQ